MWITNSKGDILLAQRSLTKTNHPGLWGPAVAGAVEEDESYGSNIKEETEEEIGLKGIDPQKANKVRITLETGDHNHFIQWYMLRIDKLVKESIIQKA